jgi:hypothetical protein
MNKLFYLLLFLTIVSCKDEIICDTSVKSYYLYAKDTLEYVKIWDVDRGNVLFSDSNISGQIKLIDDSYFHMVGPNQRINLNLQYHYPNDTVYGRFVGLCVYTDDCHVQYAIPYDTIK